MEAIYKLYPAPVYTLMKKGVWPFEKILPSYCNFSLLHPFHRQLLPFYPKATESFDFKGYDVILSSSYACSKNIIKEKQQLHICYCHTPMRAVYDQFDHYIAKFPWWKKAVFKHISHNIRSWDIACCNRVDAFIANSKFIAQRIERIYGVIPEKVIYPPVDVESFSVADKKEDYFIYLGRLAPHKRVDILIEAFSILPHLKLLIVGDGVEMERLKNKATKNVDFLGYQPDSVCKDLLKKAKGYIFMGVEDFGISLVESLAAGTPLIALNDGGACEILTDSFLGKKVLKQNVASLLESLQRFDSEEYDPKILRGASMKFSKGRFLNEYQQFVEAKCNLFFGS